MTEIIGDLKEEFTNKNKGCEKGSRPKPKRLRLKNLAQMPKKPMSAFTIWMKCEGIMMKMMERKATESPESKTKARGQRWNNVQACEQ